MEIMYKKAPSIKHIKSKMQKGLNKKPFTKPYVEPFRVYSPEVQEVLHRAFLNEIKQSANKNRK
jgi:hypothetical protein